MNVAGMLDVAGCLLVGVFFSCLVAVYNLFGCMVCWFPWDVLCAVGVLVLYRLLLLAWFWVTVLLLE